MLATLLLVPGSVRVIAVVMVLVACATDPAEDDVGPIVQHKAMYKDLPLATPSSPMLSLPDPCIEEPLLDADPDRAGPQYDCSYTLFSRAEHIESVMPACDLFPDARPCGRIVVDEQSCHRGDRIKVDVLGADTTYAERVVVQCVSR